MIPFLPCTALQANGLPGLCVCVCVCTASSCGLVERGEAVLYMRGHRLCNSQCLSANSHVSASVLKLQANLFLSFLIYRTNVTSRFFSQTSMRQNCTDKIKKKQKKSTFTKVDWEIRHFRWMWNNSYWHACKSKRTVKLLANFIKIPQEYWACLSHELASILPEHLKSRSRVSSRTFFLARPLKQRLGLYSVSAVTRLLWIRWVMSELPQWCDKILDLAGFCCIQLVWSVTTLYPNNQSGWREAGVMTQKWDSAAAYYKNKIKICNAASKYNTALNKQEKSRTNQAFTGCWPLIFDGICFWHKCLNVRLFFVWLVFF